MKLLLPFLLLIPLCAQPPTPTTTVQSNPGGPCPRNANIQYNAKTGQYWNCQGSATGNWTSGVWTRIASPATVPLATPTWQLGTMSNVPAFQGIGTVNTVLRILEPAGGTANAILALENTSDGANGGSFRLINGGAGATPTLTGSLQSHVTGTGTGMTTQLFGEDSTAAALTSISWQFNGATAASLTPSLFTAPNAALANFSAGGKQVVCMNNGVIYAGNNTGTGVPCP